MLRDRNEITHAIGVEQQHKTHVETAQRVDLWEIEEN